MCFGETFRGGSSDDVYYVALFVSADCGAGGAAHSIELVGRVRYKFRRKSTMYECFRRGAGGPFGEIGGAHWSLRGSQNRPGVELRTEKQLFGTLSSSSWSLVSIVERSRLNFSFLVKQEEIIVFFASSRAPSQGAPHQ